MASITDYLEQYEKNKKAGLGQPAGKLDLAVPTTPAQNVGSEMLPQIPMLPQGQAGVAPEGQVATPQAPSGVDPFAAQPAAVPQTPTFGLADPSSSTATGEDPFSAPIVQPATPAVADPSQLIQLKDPTSSTANQGVNNLIGFNPQYEGQSLTDFMAGRDDRSGASVQVQDPQGRFRRQAASVEGESLEDNQARTNSLFPEQAAFQQASADREARQAARPDFGEAQTRAAGTVTDTERRQARGDGMSMEDATQLTGGNRDAAKALLKRQELGLGEFKVETPEGNEPSTADRRLEFDIQKYNDIVAKEASGAALTPAEQLAREKFEYDKDRDTKSDQAGPAKTSTERNIDILMSANPELSYSDAANIATNVTSKTVNPLTGATETTNIATNKSTPITSTAPLKDSTLNLEPAPKGTSLFELGQEYTGVAESAFRGAQKIGGQLGMDIASDESIQTKQKLDAFQGRLSRAFQEDQRFSMYADKLIREEMSVKLSATKDAKTFKNNAIALDSVMRQGHADLMRDYSDLSLDSDFRAAARGRATTLENAIRDLGVTQETDVATKESEASDNPIPKGLNKAFSQEMWDVLTPEERLTLKPKKKMSFLDSK